MNNHIINLDNAVTLLRLQQYEYQLTDYEQSKLASAITQALDKIDQDCGLPGFDTASAFKEFFGRPI
jgi:hypothetical protein